MDYCEKIKKEKEWHTISKFNKKHFLNCFLFYSPERNDYNYIFPRKKFFNYIGKTIISEKIKNAKVLIAPIGIEDIKYIKNMSCDTCDISGIDISQKAIDGIIDKDINKYCGDIKNMYMFDDNSFDLVISPLFFHHFTDFGFEDFLKEIHRVLKKDGYFFALEPSSFYPITWLSSFAKKIFGNITGAVDDERAFSPFQLITGLKSIGFYNIKVCGASFSHNRFPILLAKVNNILTYHFLNLPIVKYFAWMCVFSGKK